MKIIVVKSQVTDRRDGVRKRRVDPMAASRRISDGAINLSSTKGEDRVGGRGQRSHEGSKGPSCQGKGRAWSPSMAGGGRRCERRDCVGVNREDVTIYAAKSAVWWLML